jgi:AcrR family transcriptional regulator
MRDGAQTKERIARTALTLFVEQGIAETTIRDIAQAAGVAEGTMYRHYVSKEALAWELFAGNFTAFALELDRIRQEHPTLKAGLYAMIRQFCAFYDQDPILFNYLLLAQHGQLKKVTPEMSNPVSVVCQVVADAIARGEIPFQDADVAAAMVMGIVLQVAVFKIYGRISQTMSSLAETMTAASWSALGG